MRSRIWSLSLLIASGAMAFSGEAAAYLCTPVSDASGIPVVPRITQAWVDRCIPYFINRNNSLFESEERRQLLREAFDVWEMVPGSDVVFLDLGYTDQGVGFDPRSNSNQNVVTAIEDPAELERTFQSRNQVAITVTFFSVETGEIFDGDIAVNHVGFTFDDVASETECNTRIIRPYDLRSILIHEIGHLIGFDHPPDTESTMYEMASPCETKKRSLTEDDIQGIVDVYPAGGRTMTCSPPTTDYDDLGGVQRFRDQCTKRTEGGGSPCSCRTAFRPDSDPSDAVVITLLLAGLLALRFRVRRGMVPRV